MASEKRKQVSSVSANRESGSKKRLRLGDLKKQKSEPLAEKKAKSSSVAPKPSKPPTISSVSNEQPAFPRGGANVLTPIERKQIRVQAERDVLIEQKRKNKKGLFDARDGDGSSSDGQENTFDEVGKSSKKFKSKKLSKRPEAHKRQAVEGLNYKKLPSGTLLFGGSSLHAEDREITSLQQLHVNDVVKGHICNVADIGVFVKLCRGVTAFVRVSNLSDSYLKEWKNDFKRDQLVTGRVISLDAGSGRLQLSLKNSVLESGYVPTMTFDDLKEGQIITGKVAKVEEFGVFILVDHSANVRGLCHRSEIAERRIEDARKVFTEGDAVKAKVLKLEPDVRRVNFGLKATYFGADADGESEEEVDGDEGVDALPGGDEFEDGDDDTGSDNFAGFDEEDGSGGEESMHDEEALKTEQNGGTDSLTSDHVGKSHVEPTTKSTQLAGLQVGAFDWQGLSAQPAFTSTSTPSSDTEQPLSKHKKKRKPTIQVDLTGNLDSNGPQCTDDYERLLLSEPDSSLLWLQYMAFHLDLGEIDTARQIGQRALKSISPIGQSESEKLNIWIALLNLENAYGDDNSIETTFKEACQVNDPQEIHERLASIYIQSYKHDKADQLFQTMVKKFGSWDRKIWINYATFLFNTIKEPDRGRALLSRALQTLPSTAHVDITAKFAALEFRSPAGLAERGRTIFEGLLDSFPKRVDLWIVLLDLEMQYGDKGESGEHGDRNGQVRRLFERIFNGGETEIGAKRIKNKQAKFFFKRWLEFEEEVGDERRVEGVKRRAEEWVRSSK